MSSIVRGISLDFRQSQAQEPPWDQIRETSFDSLFGLVEDEADEPGIERLTADRIATEGPRTVAYLADGSKRLACLSQEKEIDRKVKKVKELASRGISGIIFNGFSTQCYWCEQCAADLERSKGLRLPPKVVGNPDEAKRWYYPDPMAYGFDNPYNRGNRIEEILLLVEWMSDRLRAVASGIASAVWEVNASCRLGLVGLRPTVLGVLAEFSRKQEPYCVVLPNAYLSPTELELYIRKLPFDGLRPEWTNLAATSAFYHAPDELGRFILKAAIEGRYGLIIWAANGLNLSFGRLKDMTQEHWEAVRRSFAVITSYEKECEAAEGAGELYWTSKGRR